MTKWREWDVEHGVWADEYKIGEYDPDLDPEYEEGLEEDYQGDLEEDFQDYGWEDWEDLSYEYDDIDVFEWFSDES